MRTSRLLFLFGLAVLASGCNCLGREFTITRTFEVNSTGDSTCSTFSDTVNVGDDPTFNDVKQFITKVELRKITVTVTDPKIGESVATKAHGSVTVGDASNANLLTLGTYTDVPLTLNATQDIPFDAAAAANLASLVLNPPHTFTVNAQGCNDLNPAHYKFKVAVTLYAGAL